VAGPGLALRRGDALAHVERVTQLPIVGGEANRFLVPAHVDLEREAIGLPAVLQGDTGMFELTPVAHGHRLVIRALDPYAPGVRAAERVDFLVGSGEIQRGRDLEGQ